jgi:hypothetical protein
MIWRGLMASRLLGGLSMVNIVAVVLVIEISTVLVVKISIDVVL